MKDTFIKVLSALIGADSSNSEVQELKARIEGLEQALVFKAAELDKMQEIISVLVMTNPHIKVAGMQGHDPQSYISGSSDPGRVLN